MKFVLYFIQQQLGFALLFPYLRCRHTISHTQVYSHFPCESPWWKGFW